MSQTRVYGATIQANAREAKRLSALLSPTRNFIPTGQRGRFFMAATDEVQALRDADFLTEQGVQVLAISRITEPARPDTSREIEHSYCETITAGPMAPWHIRARTAGEPLLPSGGIHAQALCGRNLGGGWDIEDRKVTFTDIEHLGATGVCAGCRAVYDAEGR